MKYIAILKDSLREALDAKVLFVLLALSTLTIVLVATISVTPLPADQTMKQFFPSEMPLSVVLDSHKPEKKQTRRPGRKKAEVISLSRLEKVELLRGEANSPESDYVLTIVQTVSRAEDAGGKDDLRAASLHAVREIFKDAEEFGFLTVDEPEFVQVAGNNENSFQYRVTVHSTPTTRRIWYGDLHFAGFVPFGPFLATIAGSKTGQVGFQLFILSRLVLYFGSWVAVLAGVVITSFFIPNMLHKGTVDLLLAKPIQRWLLLLYKYIGGLTFIFLNAAYAIGGIWLVLGIRTGVWANGSLLLILTITFFFAILYAISTFIAVLTRSTVTAILVTIIAWASFYGIGLAYSIFNGQYIIEQEGEKHGRPIPEEERWGSNRAAKVIFAIHAVMPRTKDLDQLNEIIVFTDFMTGKLSDMEKFDTSQRNWWESLGVSCLWITVFVGIACLRFTFKDY